MICCEVEDVAQEEEMCVKRVRMYLPSLRKEVDA
jgi:hypothetical protein